MTTNKNIEKCLWMCVVSFITYLFLGSIIVNKRLIEIVYLAAFYLFLIIIKLIDKK